MRATEPENPTREERQLLQLVYDLFRQSGSWPTYLVVEQRLDQLTQADLLVLGQPIRGTLIYFDPHRSPASEVVLPVAGIACCEGAEEDLGRFLALLRWLIACRQGWQPSSHVDVAVPEVTSAEARAALTGEGISLDDAALGRIGALARLEGLFDGSSHQPEQPWEWTGTPGRSLRNLRSVTTLEQYLSARRAQATPAASEAQGAVLGLDAGDDESAPGAPGAERPYIFVLMPFGESWSDQVRDAIGRACASLERDGVQVKCERADEIARTGRITEQIIAAIHRAELIIADITRNNPNVMFELGFADALGKRIVVLNQDLAAAPFDIKDWRAIAYSVERLEEVEAELRRFVLAALSPT